MGEVLDLHECAEFLEVGDHALARLADRQPGVLLACFGDAPVGPDRLDGIELVVTADLEVGDVVGRRDLEGAGAEIGLDALVGDDGQAAPEQREDGRAADDVGVAAVRRVHGHRRVPQHGLGTRRRDRDAAPALEVVADVVQVTLVDDVRDFEVADRRAAARAPVDQIRVLVDVSLAVQRDEDLEDGADVALVEGEALALVVAGTAQALELVDDVAAVLLAPGPDAFGERLATEVFLRQTLSAQLLLDDVLGGDPGVVGAGQPARVLAEHAVIADEHVLDRAVEGMSHVQVARDVGRRDDDRVGLARRIRLGVKEMVAEPFVHPP